VRDLIDDGFDFLWLYPISIDLELKVYSAKQNEDAGGYEHPQVPGSVQVCMSRIPRKGMGLKDLSGRFGTIDISGAHISGAETDLAGHIKRTNLCRARLKDVERVVRSGKWMARRETAGAV
jgi:hypothetical protein